jgi:hypothetical protein
VREFDAASYGDGMADVYDQWYADLEVDAPVAALADLAGTGPVLELGVGTGRLAIPLAARGLASTVSTPRPPWWPCSRPSPAVRPSP